ncbi:hypothetical protein DRH27_05800 [Candidatus Falkowbacteria bacterium]|nr:MAG: hypothetical protein DRH27_05800 [Candidatus Falkowbacteria bacterium]
MNNKGNMALEVIGALLVIVILGTFYFVSDKATQDINDNIQNSSINNESKAIFQNTADNYSSWSDYAMLSIFIIIWLMSLISAWYTDESPILVIVSILLFIFVIIGAIFVQDAILGIIEDAEFSGQYATMPITVFLINNMVMLLTAMGLSIGLLLYLRFTR